MSGAPAVTLIVVSTNFKGSLLDLIGKTKKEILTAYPPPIARIDGEKAERLFWYETAKEEPDGPAFPIFLMARLYEGRVWAVGIRAERYHFHVELDEQGRPYFAAVPKDSHHDAVTVNWIGSKGGRPYDIGVSY